MMDRKTIALTLSPVICLLAYSVSFGQIGQLDQFHVVPPNPFFQSQATGVSSLVQAAQTFTVGLSGVLTRVDVGMYRNVGIGETITVDISRVVDGEPDFSEGGVLVRRIVSNDTVPFISATVALFNPVFSLSVDFFADRLQVVPGDTLAIIIRPESSLTAFSPYLWWGNVVYPSPYDRGSIFRFNRNEGTIVNYGGLLFDTHFRTFVLVPEPSAIALIVLSFLGVTMIRRRKN